MDKQTFWISTSNAGHNGYYVWTVIEVIEGPDFKPTDRDKKIYTECPDGTYIYVAGCNHFFTKEKMDDYVQEYEQEFYYNTVVVVSPEPKSIGLSKPMPY